MRRVIAPYQFNDGHICILRTLTFLTHCSNIYIEKFHIRTEKSGPVINALCVTLSLAISAVSTNLIYY